MRQRGFLIILYAIALHLGWAFILLLSHDEIRATPISVFLVFRLPQGMIALLFLLAASSAFVGLIAKSMRPIWRIATCSLQQLLLMASAVYAIFSVWSGTYPDGTLRWPAFILVDQLSGILAAFVHTAALWYLYARGE